MNKKLVQLFAMVGILSVLTGCGTKNQEPEAMNKAESIEQSQTEEVQKEKSELPKVEKTDKINEEDGSSEGYSITDQNYEKDLIKLHYPQISGLKDIQLQNKCNEVLKYYAMGNMENFTSKDTYELNYEVATQSKDMISIVLKGYASLADSLHPNAVVYTLNVDLKKGRIVRLQDQVELNDLAKKIIDKSWSEFYSLEGEKLDGEWENAIENHLLQYTTESLEAELKNYDITDNLEEGAYGYSYYKDGNLHIFMSVPHALGDFIEIVF